MLIFIIINDCLTIRCHMLLFNKCNTEKYPNSLQFLQLLNLTLHLSSLKLLSYFGFGVSRAEFSSSVCLGEAVHQIPRISSFVNPLIFQFGPKECSESRKLLRAYHSLLQAFLKHLAHRFLFLLDLTVFCPNSSI